MAGGDGVVQPNSDSPLLIGEEHRFQTDKDRLGDVASAPRRSEEFGLEALRCLDLPRPGTRVINFAGLNSLRPLGMESPFERRPADDSYQPERWWEMLGRVIRSVCAAIVGAFGRRRPKSHPRPLVIGLNDNGPESRPPA